MTDTSTLPQFVVSAFDGREFPDWAKQSRETLLNHFLEWNGICGYTDQILTALASIDKFLADNTEAPVPLWRSGMFTEGEQSELVKARMEELRDCFSAKDEAHEYLDEITEGSHPEEIAELYMPFTRNSTTVAECLQAIQQGVFTLEDYLSRRDMENYLAAQDIERFKLIEDGKLTPVGIAFMDAYL